MKDGLKHIIGRQVAAVIVARSDERQPHNQVFLVFTDGSNFEFWGDAFTCCGGVNRIRDIARYIESGGGEIVNVYTNASQEPPSIEAAAAPCHVSAERNLEELMTQDLAAWNLAKQAIVRAKLRADGRRI